MFGFRDNKDGSRVNNVRTCMTRFVRLVRATGVILRYDVHCSEKAMMPQECMCKYAVARFAVYTPICTVEEY